MLHRIDEIPLGTPEGTGRLYVTNFSAVGPDPQAALDRVDASVMVCLLTPHEIELRYPDYLPWLITRMPPWLMQQVNESAVDDVLQDHAARFGDIDIESLRFRSDADARALWLPIPDGGTIFDGGVMGTVAYINESIFTGKNVLVHCGAGMARTAVVGILAMISLGADAQQAAVDFRAARPGGGPDGPSQEQQIARLIGRALRLRPTY